MKHVHFWGAMFKIGDFARFSRVSVKMLRHYDDLGLLKPAHVDSDTGYRYYSADQLPELNRLVMLKDLGFTLDQIATLLKEELSTDALTGMLILKRSEVETRIQAEQERLALLNTHLQQLKDNSQLPGYDVILREVPTDIYATMRRVIPEMDVTVQLMFEELEKYVAHYHARASKPPLMRFHDPDGVDIEIAVPVSGAIPGSETVHIKEIAGHETMACVVFTGAYHHITEALRAILTWMEQHKYAMDGPPREVYLRFGADETGYHVPQAYLTQDQSQFVTELQIPVRKHEQWLAANGTPATPV